MPIPVQCASCGAVHNVADNFAGTQMQCSCGMVLVVPYSPMQIGVQKPADYQQPMMPAQQPYGAGYSIPLAPELKRDAVFGTIIGSVTVVFGFFAMFMHFSWCMQHTRPYLLQQIMPKAHLSAQMVLVISSVVLFAFSIGVLVHSIRILTGKTTTPSWAHQLAMFASFAYVGGSIANLVLHCYSIPEVAQTLPRLPLFHTTIEDIIVSTFFSCTIPVTMIVYCFLRRSH